MTRFLASCLVLGAMFAGCGQSCRGGDVDDAVLTAERERVAVVAKASEAAVAIFAAGGQGGGSGVVITPDGYALSNFHVTKGSGDAMKCGMPDGRLYDAVIVGIDPVGDVGAGQVVGPGRLPAR